MNIALREVSLSCRREVHLVHSEAAPEQNRDDKIDLDLNPLTFPPASSSGGDANAPVDRRANRRAASFLRRGRGVARELRVHESYTFLLPVDYVHASVEKISIDPPMILSPLPQPLRRLGRIAEPAAPAARESRRASALSSRMTEDAIEKDERPFAVFHDFGDEFLDDHFAAAKQPRDGAGRVFDAIEKMRLECRCGDEWLPPIILPRDSTSSPSRTISVRGIRTPFDARSSRYDLRMFQRTTSGGLKRGTGSRSIHRPNSSRRR